MSKRSKKTTGHIPDVYGIVHLSHLSTSFSLSSVIDELRSELGVNGCWLTLEGKEDLTHFLPQALELGFQFHHAGKEQAVLGLWLHSHLPNTLPKGASHTIGVGCMVVDCKTGMVLVVKEKVGPAKNRWKIVTGLVDIGEDISQAALREVFEETGLKLESVSEVIGMREMHGHVFGLSNMFFICLIQAKDGTSLEEVLKPCEIEIEEAKWMTLEEYQNLEYYASHTLYQEINRNCSLAAAKLIKDQRSSAMKNKRLPVDAIGTRIESLWYLHGEKE